MLKQNNLLKTLGVMLGSFVLLGSVNAATMNINTAYDDAKQYIKKIFLTDDGSDSGATNLKLDGESGDLSMSGDLDVSGEGWFGGFFGLSGDFTVEGVTTLKDNLNIKDNNIKNVNKLKIDDKGGIEHIFGDTDSGESNGIVLRTKSNPSNGEPIFQVESAGNSERLRVEHSGYLSTTNDLKVKGGGDSSIYGNLGIGKTSPDSKLDVNGNSDFRGDMDMNNNSVKNSSFCPDGICDVNNNETFTTNGIGTTNIYDGGGGEIDIQDQINFNNNNVKNIKMTTDFNMNSNNINNANQIEINDGYIGGDSAGVQLKGDSGDTSGWFRDDEVYIGDGAQDDAIHIRGNVDGIASLSMDGDIDMNSKGNIDSVNNLNVSSVNSNNGWNPVDFTQGIDMNDNNIKDAQKVYTDNLYAGDGNNGEIDVRNTLNMNGYNVKNANIDGNESISDGSVDNSEIDNSDSFTFNGIKNNGNLDMNDNNIINANKINGTDADDLASKTWVSDNDNTIADNQNLSSSSNGTDRTIKIDDGNNTTISIADNDNNSSNEIQTLGGVLNQGNSANQDIDMNSNSLKNVEGIQGRVRPVRIDKITSKDWDRCSWDDQQNSKQEIDEQDVKTYYNYGDICLDEIQDTWLGETYIKYEFKNVTDIDNNLSMDGEINMNNNKIFNLTSPTNKNDAANKAYVDNKTTWNYVSDISSFNAYCDYKIINNDGTKARFPTRIKEGQLIIDYFLTNENTWGKRVVDKNSPDQIDYNWGGTVYDTINDLKLYEKCY